MLLVLLVIRLRMYASGSESGIIFKLKSECFPIVGGFQLTTAFFPLSTITSRLVGGSGAVVMLAVHVSQSEMVVLE